jgi:two-component system cell cycle sensor histidine kinase/response regulator CckA
VFGTIVPARESGTNRDLAALTKETLKDPERNQFGEHENMRKDGSRVWISWTNKAVFDEKGSLVEILSIGKDITEKKRLEAQLFRAQKMEAMGTLAGGIAHDFNNILQVIQGFADLLLARGKGLSGAATELRMISDASKRGAELTRQLLTFSRKITSNLSPLNLNAEVMKTAKLLERIIPKMIDIRLHLDPFLKTVRADPSQLEQVLMNLAINARDAMEEGGVLAIASENASLGEGFCSTHPDMKPGEFVLLTISDTGCGMSRETLERVFEPFFTTKGLARGTGLGLAVSYGIVKSHGGLIECASEPGRGATFRVYLPAHEGPVPTPEKTGEAAVKGGTETILLVDDEENILALGASLLSAYGYRVLTAKDGESALALYGQKHHLIDLVVLDLIMPGMSGYQCLQALLETSRGAKVIVASGYSEDGKLQDTIAAGARSFIVKPFRLNRFLSAIREALDR